MSRRGGKRKQHISLVGAAYAGRDDDGDDDPYDDDYTVDDDETGGCARRCCYATGKTVEHAVCCSAMTVLKIVMPVVVVTLALAIAALVVALQTGVVTTESLVATGRSYFSNWFGLSSAGASTPSDATPPRLLFHLQSRTSPSSLASSGLWFEGVLGLATMANLAEFNGTLGVGAGGGTNNLPGSWTLALALQPVGTTDLTFYTVGVAPLGAVHVSTTGVQTPLLLVAFRAGAGLWLVAGDSQTLLTQATIVAAAKLDLVGPGR